MSAPACGLWSTFVRTASWTGALFWVSFTPILYAVVDASVSDALVVGGPAAFFFGIVMGGISAPHLRPLRLTIALQPQTNDDFLTPIATYLAQIGYYAERPIGTAFTFAPSFVAGWLSGRVTIAIESTRATVVGPARRVRAIRRLLGTDARPELY